MAHNTHSALVWRGGRRLQFSGGPSGCQLRAKVDRVCLPLVRVPMHLWGAVRNSCGSTMPRRQTCMHAGCVILDERH